MGRDTIRSPSLPSVYGAETPRRLLLKNFPHSPRLSEDAVVLPTHLGSPTSPSPDPPASNLAPRRATHTHGDGFFGPRRSARDGNTFQPPPRPEPSAPSGSKGGRRGRMSFTTGMPINSLSRPQLETFNELTRAAGLRKQAQIDAATRPSGNFQRSLSLAPEQRCPIHATIPLKRSTSVVLDARQSLINPSRLGTPSQQKDTTFVCPSTLSWNPYNQENEKLKNENEKLMKEVEMLKKRLENQIAVTQQYKAKLDAVLGQGPGKSTGALRKQAKFAALQQLDSKAAYQEKVCQKLQIIMEGQVESRDRGLLQTAMTLWQEITEEQVCETHEMEKLAGEKCSAIISMMRALREASGQTVVQTSFFWWHELVLISNRRRARPFLDQDESANLAISHFVGGLSSVVKASMLADRDSLYSNLLHVALDVADADEAYLFIMDPNTQFLHLRKASCEMDLSEEVVRRPTDGGIIALAAEQKCVYACSDMLRSKHYVPALDRFTYKGNSKSLSAVMCYPLFAKSKHQKFDAAQIIAGEESVAPPVEYDQDAEMVGLLYLTNKRSQFGTCFLGADLANLQVVLESAGDILAAGQRFHEETMVVQHLNGLLNLMSVDASEINLSFVSDNVVALSKSVRGAIFVVDEVSQQLYFMVDTPVGKREIRIPLSAKSLAGAAIVRNEIINIPDCYADARFDPSVDKRTGFRTKQMLCVPVTNHSGAPIGAIQIINSHDGMSFSNLDVELLQRFRVYIQIAILNKKAETAANHAVALARDAVHLQTKMAWTQSSTELLSMFFRDICNATGCAYVACYMPPLLGELLRYDSTNPVRPVVVQMCAGTATHSAAVKHSFLNVTIINSKGGALKTKDNFIHVERQWVKAQPDTITPPCSQGCSSYDCEDDSSTDEQKRCRILVNKDYTQVLLDDGEWENMIVMPIVTRYGTFVLQAAGKTGFECFSLMDEELFMLCGQQFVNMLMQYDLLRHRQDLLEIMNTDVEKINLDFLTVAVVELSRAQRGSIYLVDEVSNQLIFMIDTPSGGKKETRIPLVPASIAGAAVLTNKAINITDCYSDERFDCTFDTRTGFHSKQMLCVPVTSDNGKVIGAIQLINTSHGRAFTDLDCDIIRGLRVYVQIAILNHKAKVEANRAVRGSIATKLDARDLSLTRLTDQVVDLTQAARGTIFVVDEIAQKLHFIVDTPAGDKKEVSIPLNIHSLAGASVLNEEVLNLADCYSDPRFNKATDAMTGFVTKQLLCMPVTNARGNVIGAIQIVNSHHGMPFGKESLHLMEAFKVYAQVGILNFKARAQADVGVRIGAETLDAQEIDTSFLVDLVKDLSRAERGCIYILEDNPRRLTCRRDHGALSKEEVVEFAEDNVPGACVLNNEVINIKNCAIDERFERLGNDECGLEQRQMLCLPVNDNDDNPIGAIQIVNSHNGEPFEEEEEVLQAFKVYIQVAIENHRAKLEAHRTVRDAIDEAEDTRNLNTGDLTHRVIQLSQAARGSIFVLNRNRDSLSFMAVNENDKAEEVTIPLTSTSVAGSCIVHNEIINISNCYADERFDRRVDEMTGFKSRQILCVPVTDANGASIGCIQIINTPDGLPFGTRELELLRAFCPFVRATILQKKKEFANLLIAAPYELVRLSSF